MEVGFEGCLDMLMFCACCLLLCTLKHTLKDIQKKGFIHDECLADTSEMYG